MQNSKFRMQIQTAKNTKYKKGNVRAEVIGASSECAWCGISVKLVDFRIILAVLEISKIRAALLIR